MVRRTAGPLLIACAGAVFADQGEELYKANNCESCHGKDGSYSLIPGYPAIAGQSVKYLVRQMKDIRDGARHNGQSGLMRAVVVNVTDAQFEQIAAWLASR